jgi:hypothetical protein
METLMIDQSLFSSEDWYQQGPPSERAAPVRLGVERLGVSFISMRNGVTLHQIYRERDYEKAKAEYYDEVKSWFHSRDDETDWYIPSGFDYKSSVADNYQFRCQTHKPSSVENCQLVGRYGTYIIRFHTFMSPIMTYDDLERMLQAIDNKMAQCLNKDS